ncbi:MAG: 50S ribosomal protein L28 [Candidatus Gracilibacteria bacterium]
MSKVCEKCGKRPQVGHTISHSNIKTLRRFEPNLVKKRIFDRTSGKMVKVKVCTACLRTMVKMPRTRVKKVKTAKA